MPKAYTVTLYKNTGFNTGNIPDSPAVLAKATSFTVDAVFEWQSRGLANIRVKADWDTIKDVDYCAMANGTDTAYYVVTNVTMRSGVTAELQLTLDPLTSAGGVDNVTVISGWAKRAHAASDTIFDNILPEPWGPSNRLVIRKKKVIHDSPSGYKNLVVATCNLYQVNNYQAQLAKVAESEDAQGVAWPELPVMPEPEEGETNTWKGGSTVTFTEQTGDTHDYKLPGLYVYDLEDDIVTRGINTVRSLGIESAIASMYVIPADDVTLHETSLTVQVPIPGDHKIPILKLYDHVTGKVTEYTSGMPYLYATTKNKKALALYSGYIVTSLASGDSKSYSAYDLYAGGSSPDFAVTCDPSPDGTVYCQPTWYEGAQTQKLEQAVSSTPWYNAGFTYTTASGSAIMQMNAARARTSMTLQQDYAQQGYKIQADQNNISGLQNFVTSLTQLAVSGFALDTAGMVGAAGNMIFGKENYELQNQQIKLASNQSETMYNRAMGDNIFNTNVQANVVAPTNAFPITVSAANYFGHAFLITQTTLSDNDLARFDKFLTAYGYAQDRALTDGDLTSRTHFNYVLATDVVLTSPVAPQSVLQGISDMFASGIRIWHELPNAAAYNDNPIGA